MAQTQASSCPYGVVNLNAMAESKSILVTSSKGLHQHLHDWLRETYLNDALQAATTDDDEPLGRRIRSVGDLSMLVCAYSNARALKLKAMKRNLEHDLYFLGQLPERDAAVEAGKVLKTFTLDAAVGSGVAVSLLGDGKRTDHPWRHTLG